MFLSVKGTNLRVIPFRDLRRQYRRGRQIRQVIKRSLQSAAVGTVLGVWMAIAVTWMMI